MPKKKTGGGKEAAKDGSSKLEPWMAVQVRTFTAWLNSQLRLKGVKVKDLVTELDDGLVLIALMEKLSAKKMIGKYHSKPSRAVHRNTNLATVFAFMSDVEHLPLLNITPNDILEHNTKQILGLIWQLVMRYEITETDKGSKTLLLDWVDATLPDKSITNFTTDWRDGKNLSALVDYCKPGLIPDHASLDLKNSLENVKYAIRQAEVHLGVPPVITAEDLAVGKPDERSVMTYLSQFCGADSPGQKALLVWIQQQLLGGLTVSNFTTDWVDGRVLGALTNVLSEGSFKEFEQFQQSQLDHGKQNCEKVMNSAEKLLGIEKTMEAKEFCNPQLNIVARETYLIQFFYCKSRLKVLEVHLPIKAGTGEKAWLSLALPNDSKSSSDVAATVRGRSIGEIPVNIEPTSELSYRIEFDPQQGDVYTLQATVGGIRLKGSPFTFDLSPPHPDKVKHTNTVLPKKVGIPVLIFFDASLAGRAELTSEAVGEISGTVPLSIDQVSTKGSTHKISFIPLQADIFTVAVNFDGQPVPGSPFAIPLDTIVQPENVEVGKALIDDPGVPITVPVDVSRAGKDTLIAKCVGKLAGEIGVEFEFENEGGEGGVPIGITFIPPIVDVYSLAVFYGKTEIPGSPFEVSLYPLPLDAQRVKISDPPSGALKSGEVIRVGFDTSEAGDGEMTAIVLGNAVGDIETKVEKASKNKHFVCFTPPEKDVYHVNILWSGENVPGSPFTISLIPKDHPNPSKCKVLGLPRTSAILVENDVISFQVDTTDAGKGVLEATVESDGLKSRFNESAEVGMEIAGQNETETGVQNGKMEPEEEAENKAEATTPTNEGVATPTNEETTTPTNEGMTTPTNEDKATPTNEDKATPATDAKQNGASSLEDLREHSPLEDEVDTVIKPHIEPSAENPKIFNVSYQPLHGGKHTLHLTWSEQPIPDSPMTFDIITPRIALSDSPVVIELRTQYKRKNMKVQAISRDGGTHHKVKIEKIASGHFKLVFHPKELGVYLVHVLVKDKAIEGSPFIVRYIEASDPANIKISGLEPQLFVGEPITFTIDTRAAGVGELTITPAFSITTLDTVGASQEDLRSIRLFHNKDGTFSAIFTPSAPGEDSLDVRFAGTPIPGSPFPVSVLKRDSSEPPFDTRKRKHQVTGISGLNLESEKFRVNIPHKFKLHCEDVGEGKLEASCKPTNAANIELTEIEDSKNSYWIEILPKKTGKHSITVRFGGKHILGSPFHVQFLARGDASRCVLIDTLPECKKDLGDQVVFCISTKGAGKGIVTASATSTSKHNQGAEVPVTVVHYVKSHYNLLFEPTEGLNYLLEILYDEEGIQGSPFRIALGDASHVRSHGEGLILAWAGRCSKFAVDAEDAGPGELNVIIEQEAEDEKMEVIEPHISSVEDGQFEVSYLPPTHGKYWINAKWGDINIPGSPFEVTCKKPLEASQFSVADAVPIAYHGKQAKVVAQCSAEIEEDDKMAVSVHSSNEEKYTIEVTKGDGNFYDCALPSLPLGEYAVCLQWDGNDIEGSPYEIRVIDQPSSDDFIVEAVEAQNGVIACKVIGPDYAFMYGQLSSAVHSTEVSEEYSVPIQITEISHKESLLKFKPIVGGSYDLSIYYDMVHIRGSPFSLLSTDASQCCTKGKGLVSAQARDSNKFFVSTENAGPGELKVEIKGDGVIVNPEITNTSDMLFNVSYLPPSAGVYTVTIHWDTQQVPGSPFEVICSDPSRYSIPKPTKVGSLGKPLKVGVRENTEAPEFEKISIFARSKDRNTYPGEVKRGNDGNYICSVQPPSLGKFSIHVRCNDFEIPGSPFRTRVMPPPVAENVKTSGPGLSNGTVGKSGAFTLDISEAGHGHVSYKVQGPKDGFKIDMRHHSDLQDTIVCEYNPKYAGVYNISVMWSGVHIPDSPFAVTIGERTPEQDEEGERNEAE